MQTKIRVGIGAVLSLGLLLMAVTGTAATAPGLSVLQDGLSRLKFAWTSETPDFVLESAPSILTNAFWSPVDGFVTRQGNDWTVSQEISPGWPRHFYRLVLPLSRIVESSPLNGETGVAVIRETIVR